MKTKEELLQSIYGAEYIHADINGWMKYGMYHPNDLGFDNDEVDRYGDMYLWRPKSLQGIEDNFGWISINSEKDLPTIGTFYTILSFDENIVEREFPHPNFTLEFNKEWWLKYVTHYQEKIMPNKPLHK